MQKAHVTVYSNLDIDQIIYYTYKFTLTRINFLAISLLQSGFFD